MKLLTLSLENFRGIREATFEFKDKTRIKGCNGSGKSTIASSLFWLFSDKDYSLASNPMVRPNDAIDEVVTTVTADLDMDGKPVQIQKSQKLRRSKTGTVSLTNSYMVNSVPKSEKDFKEYLSKLGLDFEKFLACSHPGVLLAGINNKKERTNLRNLLFQMAGTLTDLDVAKSDPDLKELAMLLENYDAQEIEAVQNNTLRKIRDNYGKEGEILRAKIDGLESAKSDADTAVLKSQIDDCNLRLAEIDGKSARANEEMAELLVLQSGLMDKRFALNQMELDANEDLRKKRSDWETKVMMQEFKLKTTTASIEETEKELRDNQVEKDDICEKMKMNNKILRSLKFKFDESTTICPTCGQVFPEKQVNKIRKAAEKKHNEKVKQFKDALKVQKDRIKAIEELDGKLEKMISEKHEKYRRDESALVSARERLEALKAQPEVSVLEIPGYMELKGVIKDTEEKVKKIETVRNELDDLDKKKAEILEEKHKYEIELGKADNSKIDAQIQKLREYQVNYEKRKAEAEMILDQLSLLNMKKNTMLQDAVNSHFSIIKWVLFETLKNGTYKDACIPTIDGKKFGESMNTGLETLAKIDAMNGIQKFFNLDYPIWLDNAEHLDKRSLEKIDTEHQLIVLTVSDDERLVVE